jgi:hypothetical protein
VPAFLARMLGLLRGTGKTVATYGIGGSLRNAGRAIASAGRDALAFLGVGAVATGGAARSAGNAWLLVSLGLLALLSGYLAYRLIRGK